MRQMQGSLPYDAIAHKERPCERACGVKAITSDTQAVPPL